MLKKLVAFDTVSRNSNLAFIDFVRDLLQAHGIESRLVHNGEKTKANLLATIGPNVKGGVVLSGHTDVVPIDDQDWHTDPFSVVERDGLLYGRGTADMKAFLAISYWEHPLIKAQLAYHPEAWIADVARRRIERWSEEIAQHEARCERLLEATGDASTPAPAAKRVARA